jgi:hypothetical protein
MSYNFDELPIEVKKDLLRLSALQALGVNNWDGYESALEVYEELLAEKNLVESTSKS